MRSLPDDSSLNAARMAPPGVEFTLHAPTEEDLSLGRLLVSARALGQDKTTTFSVELQRPAPTA